MNRGISMGILIHYVITLLMILFISDMFHQRFSCNLMNILMLSFSLVYNFVVDLSMVVMFHFLYYSPPAVESEEVLRFEHVSGIFNSSYTRKSSFASDDGS